MNVALSGATGVLGRNVVPRLQERGHAVRALVQDEARAERLRRIGVEAVVADLFDAARVREAVRGCDAVLHLATRIPTGAKGDWSENDRIRREGTRNLAEAAAAADAKRYVQQSIVMLYGDRGDEVVDESTPLRPAPYIQSAFDMEELVRASPLSWTILRGGFFYGPGTGAAERLQISIPGDGRAWRSLIHVADMAHAVVTAAEAAQAGSIYNVVDDEPVRLEDLCGYIAAKANAPRPPRSGGAVDSIRCSNRRLRNELAWMPAYPTYRSGLAET